MAPLLCGGDGRGPVSRPAAGGDVVGVPAGAGRGLRLLRRGWRLRQAFGGIRRRVAAVLPGRLRERLLRGRERVPAVGRVRLGDLRRLTPISQCFGFDRGLPVDRYYIERFLARHASEIVGRVLEIGDDAYTRKFGGSRVSRSDVLHVHHGNPRATFVGDLTDPDVLPEAAFDCIVLTQTLQLIYDVRARDRPHPPRACARRRGAGHGTRHQPDRSGRMGQDVVLVFHARGAARPVQ